MTIYSLTLTQFFTITDGSLFVTLKQGDGPLFFFGFF